MKAIELRDEILATLMQQLDLVLDAVGETDTATGQRKLSESDCRLLMRDRANALAVNLADRCAEHADTTEDLARALEAAAKALRERDL